MKKTISILVIAMMVIVFAAGCSGGGSASGGGESTSAGTEDATAGDAAATTGDPLQVGLLIRDIANPYYVAIKDGAEMFLNKEIGEGNYELNVYESGGSDEKQINDAKAFLAKVKDGNGILYIDPNNAPNAAVVADLAEEAGVYWVTCWSYADGVYPFDYQYYVLHETADNVVGAYEMAKTMFDSFETPGKGKVLAIQGMLSNDASIDREKGWRQAIEEYPDVELLDIQPSDWNAQEGLKLVQTWLSKYGDDIDGILVCNDAVAVAVAEGLRAEGLNGKVKVVGFDGTDDILPLIENGDILATFSSDGYMQSGYGLSYCYEALKGELDPASMPPEERMINTKGIVISTDSLADYRAQYIDSKPDYNYKDLEFCVSSYFDINNLH
ncbi:MAG: sugar ABC transporter substrate-binding protein [Clostridiales Family XIII bacterium]|jgi:ABC-type sugar transport system substrate-binding protein|nr:sugar ABC transporter substrate-binding protein [Clostridiales Family XIII bacterium]